MKHFSLILFSFILLFACKTTPVPQETEVENDVEEEVDVVIEDTTAVEWKAEDHYTKQQVYIPMRDSVKLYTTIYTPKDISATNTYPIIMQRTCYSSRPYGADEFKTQIGPNETMMKDGYIVVYQDVRGRWMSEGEFTNMTPIVWPHTNPENTDESTDTYDTVEWLVNNIEHHNGRVGQWGISYPGFYATNAAIDAHPAMKAVSPQAPIGDFYFDDFHHNGAYTYAYWSVNNLFGIQKTEPVDTAWYEFPRYDTPDIYDFYHQRIPISEMDKDYPLSNNFFWEEIKEHPNYDEFWQKRGIIQHLKTDIRPAMMIVGGFFDAEDLYGPLETYKTIEAHNPDTYNTIVMGPWSHGDWARKSGRQAVSNVFFGEDINLNYQNEVETKFFHHFLKGSGDHNTGLPEAWMFDTGEKTWTDFPAWPPKQAEKKKFYFGDDVLSNSMPNDGEEFNEFISDPEKPVPHNMDIKPIFIPRKYMADDQRQQSRRPDVLVFETDVLEEDVTLAGPIWADLFVSTTGSGADWVVKVIDVYPPDTPNTEETQDHIAMGGYQLLVRGEAFRGRYRNSFEFPEPFVPNKVTEVSWQLQDAYHTFKKGHKIMVQVHSSWFPYIDMNPQTYVPNIFEAAESDFQKQTHRVYHNEQYKSGVSLSVIE